MLNKTVTIKNMVNADTYVSVPHLNLRLHWPQMGAIARTSLEKMEEAIYDPGFESMLRSGSLYIEDMEQKIHLGLEAEDTAEPTLVVALTPLEQDALLSEEPATFQEKFNALGHDQKMALVDRAVATKALVSRMNNTLIKRATGIDISEVIDMHEEREEDGNTSNK